MLLNKEEIVKIFERKYNKGDICYIHHPITQDIIKVKIVKSTSTKYIVRILENSPYFGQPDFKISKNKVIGIA